MPCLRNGIEDAVRMRMIAQALFSSPKDDFKNGFQFAAPEDDNSFIETWHAASSISVDGY